MLRKALPKYIIPIVLLLMWACSEPVRLDGISDEEWRSDRLGCQSLRMKYLDTLSYQKDKLLELSQNGIKETLGAPDEHELDERRRKLFYYYLQPGPSCTNAVENPILLEIRFNAVGLASDIFLKNY